MKNINKVIVLSTLFLLMFPISTFAAEFRAGQQPSFTSSEKIEGNIYMAGGSVTSSGNAEKDLMIAGGTVFVSGPVLGDLFITGGNISVLNQVSGDLRIGGGNIMIGNNILGDAVIGGGQIILSGKSIGGDAVIAGGMVRMDSEVKGNVKIAAGEIFINAPIGGSVDIRAKKLTLGPNADIKGDLKYQAEKIATIENGGIVRGETIFTELKKYDGTKKDVTIWMSRLFTLALVAKFLMLLTASLIMGLIFRRYTKELVEKATENPLKELGRGIITLIVLPILSIILLITIIGIPFGILGLLSFIILSICATILTPIFLGALVYKWISKKPNYIIDWKTILLGTIVYSLLGFIPFIGWIAVCISVVMTLGAMLNIKGQMIKEWR